MNRADTSTPPTSVRFLDDHLGVKITLARGMALERASSSVSQKEESMLANRTFHFSLSGTIKNSVLPTTVASSSRHPFLPNSGASGL